MTSLAEQVYGAGASPYANFRPDEHPDDMHGWNSRAPVFERVIAETRPALIVEVGTWKGASAIHMAQVARRLGIATQILCIDTWLGAREMWDNRADKKRFGSLRLKHGYPRLYYTFLANVVRHGLQGVITPFPQTSLIAARWLAARRIQADLIYVDGSHDEWDVAADLMSFWPMLRAGGVMFGDDYEPNWPGVMRAVDGFAFDRDMSVDTSEPKKWILRKA